MKNPFQLTFTLRQHTPIIHFQHDQDGATLRATEVKPKLDRYLFEYLSKQIGFEARKEFYNLIFNGNDSQKQWKFWLVGKGQDLKPNLSDKQLISIMGRMAFDYRLSINLQQAKSQEFPIGYPMRKSIKDNNNQITGYDCEWNVQFPNFFGNMKSSTDVKEPKFFRFIPDEFHCSISASNQKLLENVKNLLVQLFLQENFGCRQNKGFGSFSVVNINGKIVNQVNVEAPFFDVSPIEKIDYKVSPLPKKIAFKQDSFDISLQNKLTQFKYENSWVIWLHNQYDLFNQIELLYKTLRSGINIPNKFYFKSLMFQYAKKLTPAQQWDKRTMREKFYATNPKYIKLKTSRPPNGTLNYSPQGVDKYDEFLFRDLLGLSSIQEWGYYRDTVQKEGVLNEEGKCEIQRFKSPLTFKPIRLQNGKFRVYILANSIPAEYIGKEFMISSNTGKKVQLRIPPFNISSYLKDCFSKFVIDITSDTDPADQFDEYINANDSHEAKILKEIYIQLSSHYNVQK